MRRYYVQIGVVVVVIAICGGLLMDAIVKVREAGNRSKCVNNLKQLVLACRNYTSAYPNEPFPRAVVPDDELVPERRLTWIYIVLPYIESNPLYRSIDPKQSWDSPRNWPHVTESWRLFRCPSHPDEGDLPYYTHYVAMAGIGEDAAYLSREDPRAGMMGYEASLPLPLVKLENTTLLLIETTRDNGPWAAGGPPTLRALVPGGPPYFGKDGQFTTGHSSAIHAAFVDGSVHALHTSLDPRVLEALATIAGKEEIDSALLDW
jgi:hypothetical protein